MVGTEVASLEITLEITKKSTFDVGLMPSTNTYFLMEEMFSDYCIN